MQLDEFFDALFIADNFGVSGLTGKKPDPLSLDAKNCRYDSVYKLLDTFIKETSSWKSRKARAKFQRLYVALVAKAYDLTPTMEKTAYKLLMTTKADTWWSWDHWGLAIDVPGNKTSIVQTIPDCALYHAGARMWGDDNMSTEVCLTGLKSAHVKRLGKIEAVNKTNKKLKLDNEDN